MNRETIQETPEGYIAALETMAYAWSGGPSVGAPLSAGYDRREPDRGGAGLGGSEWL